MNKKIKKPHGQLRRSQLLTTYGPGALFDLPKHSVIVAGLQEWPQPTEPGRLQRIHEPRLARSIQRMKPGKGLPELYSPPVADDDNSIDAGPGIVAYRFPEWFVVQEKTVENALVQSRRLIERKFLNKQNLYDGRPVVATRFVVACSAGHVDDVDWRFLAHGHGNCKQQLWLDERGTSGDLRDLVVRCECGANRNMAEASDRTRRVLGRCKGRRPWLGVDSREECHEPARLLNRTGSNAYFAQTLTLLSIPEHLTPIGEFVAQHWNVLTKAENSTEIGGLRMAAKIGAPIGIVFAEMEQFTDEQLFSEISRQRQTRKGHDDRPIKQVELDALLAVPEGFGVDVPLNENFYARRLPENHWRGKGGRLPQISAVVRVHRLREVMTQIGFTRFEPLTVDINGEYSNVTSAEIAESKAWYPAVENRGEGIFIQLDAAAVEQWAARPAVIERVEQLKDGFERWKAERNSKREFPGGRYIMLHTLSHLLLQSIALSSGYALNAIRERIYVDADGKRYGILLYTASPDSGGTLGGLVQQARSIVTHLTDALRNGALCSNDPICAQHSADDHLEGRELHGAACHGCTLIGESSCEMYNDFLDRALVVPVIGNDTAAFFANEGL
jgi:hypothetical protein